MFIYSFPKWPAVCFGKSCGLNDLCVKLQFIVANFLIIGQYVHLPNLVQMPGMGVGVVFCTGGYMSEALVSMSLILGSLLNPTIGLLVNSCPQSALLVIMFQFLWIIFLMLGLHGLKLVTMTGVSIGFLVPLLGAHLDCI